MKKAVLIFILLTGLSEMPINNAFAAGEHLKTGLAAPNEVKGVFTLILYGGRYFNDLETIAIFDMEGNGYTFEPYAPEFDYKIKKGLSAKEALREAEDFIRGGPDFQRAQLSKILAGGHIIGFELRPLYRSFAYGISDVLDVDYRLEGNKVIVKVKLLPEIERRLFDGDMFKGRGLY